MNALGLTIGGVLAGLGIQFFLNSAIIWIVTNHMLNLGEKTPFKKCMLCTLTLAIVSIVSLAALYIPIPFLNVLLALIIWYKGSIAAIEGSIEVHQGALTIWILFSLVSFGLILGLSRVMGS